MQNRIDTFDFIDLAGPPPDTVRQQVQAFARAGVDGVTIVADGRRGTMFTLRSKVDCDDLAAARALYVEYTALIGEDPVPLVYQGIDLESEEAILFAVLDVKQAVLAPLAAASGGLSELAEAWLECDWTLIAIEPPEEEE